MASTGFYSFSSTFSRSRDTSTSKSPHTQLKSSIPVPTPVQRRDGRTRSASSCYSQPIHSSIPFSMFERNKTSLSLSSSNAEPSIRKGRPKTASGLRNPYPNIKSKIDNKPPISTLRSQFYPRSSCRNSNESGINSARKSDFETIDQHTDMNMPEPNKQARSPRMKSPIGTLKSDNMSKTPRSANESYNEVMLPRASFKLDNEPKSPRSTAESHHEGKSPRASSKLDYEQKSPRSAAESYSEEKSPRASYKSNNEPNSTVDAKSPRTDDFADKQRQLLTIYNELKKIQPDDDMQHLEGEICSMMEKKTLSHLEGLSKGNAFVQECTPEFLTIFEKQMQKMSESWLKLISNIITTKYTMGRTALNRLSMPDPTLDLHDEITRFLMNLIVDEEPLDERLRKVEEEQLRVMTVVMHNVMALTKEYGELQDEYSRLKKTQDTISFQQNEQLAILGQENKELSKKYALLVERYNIEKSKGENQEKNLDSIQREMLEVRKLLKFNEGRCNEIEMRTKKADAGKRSLELAIRNMELTFEKEGKQHRDLFEKYSNSVEIINKLKYELEQNRCATSSLEESNRELQTELKNMKASLEENEQNRKELVEEITNKSKKLNELKEQMGLLQSNFGGNPQNLDFSSNIVMNDLTRSMQDKDNQVYELKKKHSELENQLKEAATRERMLMKQVQDLMKNRTQSDVIQENLIKDLRYKVKDLEQEKAELEKIVAQQTLELDQRDLMMREHAKLLQVRDDLIPMIREKKDNDKQCTEKLMAIVYENYKSQIPEGYNVEKVAEKIPYKSLEALEKYYGLDPKMVDKELSFRQEKMTEMFNLLEHKQMEVNKLERRIRELEDVHLPALSMKGQAQNKWGFLPMFSGIPESKYR